MIFKLNNIQLLNNSNRYLFLILLCIIGLGLHAQPYILDTTFQPFFNIRSGIGKGHISDIHEDSKGKLFITGSFDFTSTSTIQNDGLTSVGRFGNRNVRFLGFVGGADYFAFATDTLLMLVGDNIFNLPIDSSGAIQSWNWVQNMRSSVRCYNGYAIPYFFDDGSSIHGNGQDNFGNPCSIINPPDTFQGKHLIKLTPQGLWDSTFNVQCNNEPKDIIEYDSNRLLLAGNPRDFMQYNHRAIHGLCRIYKDGTLDTTFQSPLADTSSTFKIAEIDQDGGFFLIGNFWLKNKLVQNTIVKLNLDGSLDSNFMNFFGPNDTVYGADFAGVSTMVKTIDNGYLVGGTFNYYQGHSKNNIAKIDSAGNVESQHFTSAGPDSSISLGSLFSFINVIKKSKLGGYYVGGDFLKWDGRPVQPIIRLTDLNTGTGFDDIEFKQPENQVKIFPNPSSGLVQIISTNDLNSVNIYNFHGKIIKSVANPTNFLNLDYLKSGIYYLIIQLSNGSSTTKKLVITRN